MSILTLLINYFIVELYMIFTAETAIIGFASGAVVSVLAIGTTGATIGILKGGRAVVRANSEDHTVAGKIHAAILKLDFLNVCSR